MHCLKINRDRVICKTCHPSLYFKCYTHAYVYIYFKKQFNRKRSHLHHLTFLISPKKNMNPKLICFSLFIAALASNHFLALHVLFFEYLNNFNPKTFSLPLFSTLISHHHHHHDGKKIIKSICDDFPLDIPPPDTNTTSFICVDRNGCCNFTTVQAAVDAVGVLSPKRTIVWINIGIYLWVFYCFFFFLAIVYGIIELFNIFFYYLMINSVRKL